MLNFFATDAILRSKLLPAHPISAEPSVEMLVDQAGRTANHHLTAGGRSRQSRCTGGASPASARSGSTTTEYVPNQPLSGTHVGPLPCVQNAIPVTHVMPMAEFHARRFHCAYPFDSALNRIAVSERSSALSCIPAALKSLSTDPSSHLDGTLWCLFTGVRAAWRSGRPPIRNAEARHWKS